MLVPQKDVCCSSLSWSSSKWYHASWCRLNAWKRETHILSTFQFDKIMMPWYDAKRIYPMISFIFSFCVLGKYEKKAKFYLNYTLYSDVIHQCFNIPQIISYQTSCFPNFILYLNLIKMYGNELESSCTVFSQGREIWSILLQSNID